MKTKYFDTPILFLIFNRPETEKKVLEVIRKIKPKKMYVAADGPRPNKEGEKKRCEGARRLIDDIIDWPCEVKTLYREKNLGCKIAVSSAIDWFFENEEMGIILEDDCLPDITFFDYCEKLLIKYEHNENVGIISGNNFIDGKVDDYKFSYFFSTFPFIWGWASWRRVWEKYDIKMKKWPKLKDSNWLSSILKYEININHWKNNFDNSYDKKIDTWDYQFVFSLWSNKCLCVVPKNNLVTNIGFGNNGTHESNNRYLINNNKLEYPINYLDEIIRNETIDNYIEKYVYFGNRFSLEYLILKIKNIFINK